MDAIDFVHLAWHVLYEQGNRDLETLQVDQVYEDDFIRIDASQTGLAIEVTRKAVDDPDRPHLSVENPVTMVSSATQTAPPEIIRHHGENIYIAPHMMYLIELSETFREFFNNMQAKYPDLVVKYGI